MTENDQQWKWITRRECDIVPPNPLNYIQLIRLIRSISIKNDKQQPSIRGN